MKKRIMSFIALVLLAGTLITGCVKVEAVGTNAPPLKENDAAPEFSAELYGGGTFTLSMQKGRVVVLNFWATWCEPCVAEMPAFQRLHDEYGDKVSIIAVDYSEDQKTVNKFVKKQGYTFPIAYDVDGSVSAKYPIRGIPYTFIIGSDGNVRKIYAGAKDADTQYNEYKTAIDAILSEK